MYIQSFWAYAHDFGFIVLPKHHYSEMEMHAGKRNIIEVTEDQLEKLRTNQTFNDLVKENKYRILNTLPPAYRSSMEQMKEKDNTIAELKAKIADLEKNQVIPEKRAYIKKDKTEVTI